MPRSQVRRAPLNNVDFAPAAFSANKATLPA
jgi:hypothetical protein